MNWKAFRDYLVALADEHGLKVKLLRTSEERTRLHDYAGMNPAAAKAMGYEMESNEIYIDATLPMKTQAKNLFHELNEYGLMTVKNRKYWSAHVEALKEEKECDIKEIHWASGASGGMSSSRTKARKKRTTATARMK